MTPSLSTPVVPEYLSLAAAKQWTAAYAKALDQAKIDQPNNASIQRGIALRAANALLAVPAPKSAADIDKLEPWQVRVRETRTIKGEQLRVCVTTDGRKYSFPIQAVAQTTQGPLDIGKLSKADLVDHALSVHGLSLDASSTKAEMIDAINAHVDAATGAQQS